MLIGLPSRDLTTTVFCALMLCTMGMWGDFSITGGLLLPRFKIISCLIGFLNFFMISSFSFKCEDAKLVDMPVLIDNVNKRYTMWPSLQNVTLQPLES
jgi:hypothetical protein